MSPDPVLTTVTSPTAIELQLQKVIESTIFFKSERLSRFLTFTVRSTLEGRAEIVKESVLAFEVFDRDSTYDPRVDSVVRVQASRLRIKLKEYYEGAGADDPVEITYPRGTYVPVFTQRHAPEVIEDPSGVTQQPSVNRSRYFLYAALWILSILVGHILIAAGVNEVRPPRTAVQPVTSRDFTPVRGLHASGSKL